MTKRQPSTAAPRRTLPSLVALAMLAASIGTAAAVSAAPTPVPGGANQIKGITGTLSSTLFNGQMRVKKMALRTSTPDEGTAPAGGSSLTFTYIVSNGTSKNRFGAFSATIADADGVTIPSHVASVYSAYYSVEPGAAARGKLVFSLPDPSFVPVKILLVDNNGNAPAFRINLKKSDLPAMAAPSPTPSP